MKFLDLDAPMGGDGLSWDTAYNLSNLVMAADDEIWVKEHDGYVISSSLLLTASNLTIYAGFDSSLTGTDGNPNERYGLTKILTDGGDHEGLSFSAGGSTISRFWVKGFEHSASGGAVTCAYSGNVIEDCVFEKCKTSQKGGAVYTTEAIEIRRSSFIRCEADQGGGGVYLEQGGTVEDTLFTNCMAMNGNGGGINSFDTEMDRCTVVNNQAFEGGGIYIRATSGSNYVRDTVVAKNIASNYGGIYSLRFTDFTNNTVVDNVSNDETASCSGIQGGTGGTVSNSIVRDNKTQSISGYTEKEIGVCRGTSIHVNGNVYIVGNRTPTVYKYDIENNALSIIGTLTTIDYSNNFMKRYSSFCIGSDDNIYIAPSSTDYVRINTSTDTIENIGTNSQERAHCNCIASGDRILYLPDKHQYFSVYDISTQTLHTNAGSSVGTEWNKFFTATFHNGYAYIFPGGDTEYRVIKFDVSSMTWTKIGADMPTAPQLYKTDISVLHTHTSSIFFTGYFETLPYVWRLDLSSDTWSQVADFSSILGGGSTVKNHNFAFMSGGWIYLVPYSVNSFIRFDPYTYVLETVSTDFPAPGLMQSTTNKHVSPNHEKMLSYSSNGILEILDMPIRCTVTEDSNGFLYVSNRTDDGPFVVVSPGETQTYNGTQVSGFPSGSVTNSNVNDASGTGGLGGQEGSDCIDEDVEFLLSSYLNPYKIKEGELSKRGGNPSAPLYSGIDRGGNTREAVPSIGAWEELIEVEETVTPLTPNEIIEDLVNEEAKAYWTAERIDSAIVITTNPVYYQRIHTTLDLIPVTLRILWNVYANAYFMDIRSVDGTINATGLRLSPGVDILDGLAITELGKMFITDMQMKKEEPTFGELGDRFILWYLPREAAQ